MRGLCVPFNLIRRTHGEKVCCQMSPQLPAHDFIDQLAVHRLAGEPRHYRLHDTPQVLGPSCADFVNDFIDHTLHRGRIDGRWQVSLERDDLGGFFVRQIVSSAVAELLIESRLCLMSDTMTCCASPSSSCRLFSTSRFISAAFAIRSAPRRS